MKEKGLALVTVLIFTLVMTILAGAILALMTTEARLIEHQIRRIRAYYAVQAGIVDTLEKARKGTYSDNDLSYTNNTTTTMDNFDYLATTKISKFNPTGPPKNTRTLEATVDYSL